MDLSDKEKGEIAEEVDNWIQLLQLGTIVGDDYNIEYFSRYSMIHYFIRKNDLKKRDFSKVDYIVCSD